MLIVNADDFGQSQGINRGVASAHERGIVTSASLMVRWPAAAEAAAYARAHGALSVGLHVDFAEWAYRDGAWTPVYQVGPLDDDAYVREEVIRQIGRFRALMGREPTHLDSHQHVHRSEPLRSALRVLSQELGVPLRGETTAVSYCGAFYGQTGRGEPYPEGITEAALLAIIAALPAGVTELGCHPAEETEGLESMYLVERLAEERVLRSAAVRRALIEHDVGLGTFSDLSE